MGVIQYVDIQDASRI